MVETIKSQVDVDQTDHSQDKKRSTKPVYVKPRELYFKQAPDKNTALAKSQLPSNQVTAREKHFNWNHRRIFSSEEVIFVKEESTSKTKDWAWDTWSSSKKIKKMWQMTSFWETYLQTWQVKFHKKT